MDLREISIDPTRRGERNQGKNFSPESDRNIREFPPLGVWTGRRLSGLFPATIFGVDLLHCPHKRRNLWADELRVVLLRTNGKLENERRPVL